MLPCRLAGRSPVTVWILRALAVCAAAGALDASIRTAAHASPNAFTTGPEQWVEQLGAGSTRVRRDAAWRLGSTAAHWSSSRSFASRVTAALATLLAEERDPATALTAVYALSQIGGSEASAALATVARSNEARASDAVRAAALRASTTVPESWLSLCGAGIAGAPAGAVHEAVVDRLAALSSTDFARVVNSAREASSGEVCVLRAMGRRGDLRWVSLLVGLLPPPGRSMNAARARAALDALGAMRATDAAEAVLAVARSGGDLTLRRSAIRALASLGGGFDAAVLVELSADPGVRDAALDALSTLGARDAVDVAASMLRAPWSGDRRVAAETLGAIGGPDVIAALVARSREEPDVDARRALWRAVAQIGGRPALDALRASEDDLAHHALAELLLREGNARVGVRGDTAGALLARAVGGEDVALDGDVSTSLATIAAAGLMAPQRAHVAWLARQWTRRDDEGGRVAVVLSLASVARAHAADDVREAACGVLLSIADDTLEDPSPARWIALSELGALGVSAARSLAARAVMAQPSDPIARHAAVMAAGDLRASAARAALVRAVLTDDDEAVRAAAASALAAIDGAAAAPTLREAVRVATSLRVSEAVRGAMGGTSVGRATSGGVSVLRASGVTPGSVWRAVRADGRAVWGVAFEDGELWLRNASTLDAWDLSPVR